MSTTRARRADHDAAVTRRLQLLGEELAGVRGERTPAPRSPAVSETHTRVRRPAGPREDDPSPEVTAPPASVVPLPGRHAARRTTGDSAGWLPETVRGRVALGPGPLAVVAVLVALGLGVSAWWVIRSEPTPVAPVAPVGSTQGLASPAASAAPGPTEAGSTTGETVTVDVAGKVRRPGIVVLDLGARVVDALREAGGARRGVDLSPLNLARVLVDGEQVVVGIAAPAVGLPAATAPVGADTGGPLVNLNTADLTTLEGLPEVGPVTAQAIVTWRESNGGFTAVSELLEVDGIGEATLATVTPFVTV